MTHAPHERAFHDTGNALSSLLNEQDDGNLTVTLRLADDSLLDVPRISGNDPWR